MNFVTERIRKDGIRFVGWINATNLQSFAEEVHAQIEDSQDGQVILKIVDIDGKMFPEAIPSLEEVLSDGVDSTFKERFIDKLDRFIYDALFAINGGVNASFDAGFWAADKYAKWRGKPRLGGQRDAK